MKRFLFTAICSLGFIGSTFATHLCGADIRYSHLGGLTYRVEVRLYLNSFAPSDVPELILAYGDGVVDTIPAQADLALGSECCDRLRTYVGEHTFSGPGIYIPSVLGSNRTPGILNMPGSVDTPMCIGAMLLASPGLTNSSPEFASHSVFSYYNGNVLTHELQPFDADGDSLSFELVVPDGEECGPIAGYQFPDEVVPGPYTASVNSNGVFQWDAPQLAGYYTIAIRCTEWRAGDMIGTVTRDMILCVPTSFTAVPEAVTSLLTVSQISLDGRVTIQTERSSTVIDILDTRGALVQRVSSTGTRTLIATDAMAPGMYVVRMSDDHGAITNGRFLVAR